MMSASFLVAYSLGSPHRLGCSKSRKISACFFCQTTSGKACAHDKRTKREKERPERAVSPEPRATPWVSVHKRLRPVRAKVWANGWLLLLPLQGVGYGDMAPRALPWARDLLPFQGARGEGCGDSTVAHFACKVRGAKVAAIARAENPTRSCPRALVMFATCS